MIDWFVSGGVMMWPVAASAVLCVAAVVGVLRSAPQATPLPDGARRHAILFWGVVAAVLGVLGTCLGLAQMGRAVQQAGGASPQLAWSGVSMALITSQFGLLVLLASLLLWFLASRRTAQT